VVSALTDLGSLNVSHLVVKSASKNILVHWQQFDSAGLISLTLAILAPTYTGRLALGMAF